MRHARTPNPAAAALLAALVWVGLPAVVPCPPAVALADGGTPGGAVGAGSGSPPGIAQDRPVAGGAYAPPVDAPVVDPFRPPAHRFGPGNRGLEYATVPGSVVRAIGGGRVAFAGPVGGRLVVSVEHPDGRRSTYTWLASIDVSVGQLVARGEALGTASRTLHLGVLVDGDYVDPASLFVAQRRRAVLVPTP